MLIKRKQKIAAHPTEYKGLVFRSKLEVRWAFFFDCLKVKWEYESIIYRLRPSLIFPSGKSYLPDFDLGFCTAEVKPTNPVGEELAKALGTLRPDKPFYFLIGIPGSSKYINIISLKGSMPDFGIIPIHEAFRVKASAVEDALDLNAKMLFQKKR